MLILLYHRVAELPTDPLALAVSPAHFDEHMQILRERYAPVRLCADALQRSPRDAERPPVAVTFDDGYADNYDNAKDILGRHDVPAVCFVVPPADREAPCFWWDRLEALLLHPGTLPPRLRLSMGDDSVEWDLGQASEYAAADFNSLRRWNVLSEDGGPRQAVYRDAFNRLRPMPVRTRDDALRQLRRVATRATTSTHHQRLTAERIARLQDDFLDVGAHTMNHPVLSRLSTGDQAREIIESKRRLEEILGRTVDGFSYPYGTRRDYDRRTVEIVKQAGFAYACANCPGIADASSNRFELPRMIVRDWDGDTFARRLREFHATLDADSRRATLVPN